MRCKASKGVYMARVMGVLKDTVVWMQCVCVCVCVGAVRGDGHRLYVRSGEKE